MLYNMMMKAASLVYRRPSKLYFMLVPIFLYICLMYRMLESACLDTTGSNKENSQSKSYIPSEASSSRRIMQYPGDNKSSLILELAQEYEYLEHQRRHILQSLNRLIEDNYEMYESNMPQVVNSIKGYSDLKNVKLRDLFATYNSDSSAFYGNTIKKPKYLINCTNIQEVRLKTKIGHGVTKQTFKSDFNGIPVAVKMVTRHQSEVKSCIENINVNHPKKEELRSRCFVFPTMKMMKEILLLEQLDHPGFVRLLGYCIRNDESDTSDLSERGIVSVFELGQRFLVHNIQTLTWQQRIKYSIDLADFLVYLEHSPLGSLRVRDFKEEHFLLVNDTLKMIDLDDVDNLEPSCQTYSNSDKTRGGIRYGRQPDECEFNLSCRRGLCIGFNAKQNMKFMNKLFFKRLLYPTVFPKALSQDVGYLLADIDSNGMNARDLFNRFHDLLGKM